MNSSDGGSGTSYPVGGLKVYLYCLYLGWLFFILGILRFNTASEVSGSIVGGAGFILLVVSSVFLFIRLYQVWRLVIKASSSLGLTPSVQTPGSAVGFLFIPFFNLYWIFKGVGRLPRDLNAVAEASGIPSRVSAGLGSAVAIFFVISVIPLAGMVSSTVIGIVLMPVLMTQVVGLARQVAGVPAPLPERWHDIRSLPELLNQAGSTSRTGLVLAFPASKLSALLFYFLAAAPISYFLHPRFYKFTLAHLLTGLLAGILFVIVGSFVRRAWLLPLVWGLVWVPIGFSSRYTFAYINPDQELPELLPFILDPGAALDGFLWGVLFMGALVLAVRIWGLRFWSLPLALLAGFTLYRLPTWITNLDLYLQFSSFRFIFRIQPVVEITVLGLLLFLFLRPPAAEVGEERMEPNAMEG